MTVYVFDACALVAFFKDEEGCDKIDELLRKAVDGEIKVYISIVNLLEVYYGFIRDIGIEKTREIMNVINETPIIVINTISEKAFHEAARMKTTYKMSLGDCIGLATTLELSGKFVTSDHHELDPVAEKETDFIFWYR